MSNAALLKVYDGLDPELAFGTAAPGTSENIKQVLLNTPNAGDADGGALSDVGALTCLSITKSTNGAAAALFTIAGMATQGIALVGPVGASLTATTGGCSVVAADAAADVTITAGGDVELSFLAGNLILKPLAADLTAAPLNAAANGPTYLGAVRQLKIKVGAVDYYVALNPAPFA